MPSPSADIPVYEPDLFSPAALTAPLQHYRAIRDLGAVVRLREPDVYMLARFDDVRNALQASDTLISSKGVGFSDEINTAGAPNVIQSDGDLHRRLRAEIVRPLSPAQLKQHRAFLKDMISERIKSLVDQGPFDAMAEIARFLPVAAISEMVGLPPEGRAAMLKWAAATFNAIGPRTQSFENDFKLLKEARAYINAQDQASVRKDSWAGYLFDAVTAGRLSDAEARGALSAYVLPSLDTTILTKGHLLHFLASDAGQWRLLRENSSLVSAAVTEGVRHSSVVRWFSRVAETDYRVEGAVIPAGARVMLLYGSANHDERRFENPDRFDMMRDARSQLAWGTGVHMCAGMHLSRLEMEVMLEALIEHCAVLQAGAPTQLANRGLYGFASLPFELKSAA